jgi:hypothetical protein
VNAATGIAVAFVAAMPRHRPFLSLLATASFVALALSTVACTRVRVDDARGPDGSNEWKSISCRHMDKRCFKAAADLCPNGYYFARASGPMPAAASHHDADGDDEPGDEGATSRAAPHPQAGVNAKTLPPQEGWDPGMYSRKRGTILVQCADVRATAAR